MDINNATKPESRVLRCLHGEVGLKDNQPQVERKIMTHHFVRRKAMKTRMGNVILGALLVILVLASSGYADLSDGLVAYYPFNGNANDESGNGNNGTVYGASLTTDRLGNPSSAYVFDGTNDYIDVADAPDLNPTDAITITAWFKADSFASGWPHIVDKSGPDGTGYFMLISQIHHGNPCVGFAVEPVGGVPTGATGPADGRPTLEANTWYFAAGVYNGSAVTVYVGSSDLSPLVVTSENYSGNMVPSSNNLNIARDGSFPYFSERYFHGAIDEVRIYNRALSESEIEQLAGIAIEATIDVDPDTLSLSSKDKWVNCYIELPSGYEVMDIDGSTVKLETIPAYIGADGWARPGANSGNIMDHDGDGIRERMVKFDRSAVQNYLIGGASGYRELTVTGNLVDGRSFEGVDVIRVVNGN